jgi:hypothetical protein
MATRLSPENQVPLGGYRGGHSPPPPKKKMVPFYRKKNRMLNTTRPKPRANPCGVRAAKGKDAQVGDSLRLRQDMALLPCLLTYSYS